jgi:hypothetical protein
MSRMRTGNMSVSGLFAVSGKVTYIIQEPDERDYEKSPPVVFNHETVWYSRVFHALPVSLLEISKIGVRAYIPSIFFRLLQFKSKVEQKKRRNNTQTKRNSPCGA